MNIIGSIKEFNHLRDSKVEKRRYYETARIAVELKADAIIRYNVINNSYISYMEMGIPVRRSA